MVPPPPTATRPSGSRALARLRLLAPFALVLAPLVAVSAHVLAIDTPISFWGDQALTDIAAGRALTLDELLGPYSRFGWHHPGPSWLFLLGLFRWLGGGTTSVAIVAAIAVHALAAVLVVVAGYRIAGEGGAWVSALAVLAVVQTLGLAERVAYIWNPWAIVLPALLYIALCVMVADHRRPPAPPVVGVLLCGSFLLQTHVGSALLVVVLPLVAAGLRYLAIYFDQRRFLSDRPRPPKLTRAGRTLTGVGIVLLVLVWTPPLVQQVTRDPANITALERYARESHPRHSNREALVAVGNELRAFPFLKDTPERFQESNNTIYIHMGRRYEYTPYVYLAAAVLLVGLGLWRRDRTAVTLAVVGGAAILIGVQSAKMADGPLFPYLVAWTVVAAVPVWAAAASIVAGLLRGRRIGVAALAGVVAAVSAVCVYQAVHDAELEPHLTFPAGLEAAKAVAPALDTSHGPVLLELATGGAMPVAAAVADQLYREGRPWRVNREFVFMFGDASRPRGDAHVGLYLARIEDELPVPADARELGIVRNTQIYVVDRPPAGG